MTKTKAPQDFAGARARLDEILDELEQDAGDVDQLAARIKEAAQLIRFCRERLSAARQEVEQVVAELAVEETTPEPEADEPPPEESPRGADEGGPLDPGGELPF